MKKLTMMILILISIAFTFVGCGNNEEKLCKELVKNFAVDIYNQSCDELEKLNTTSSDKNGQENYESNLKYSFDDIKEYFTEEGFKSFENNRTLLNYFTYIIKNKKNMVFFDISYDEVIRNTTSINVRCTVSFNLMNKNLLKKNKKLIEEFQNELVFTLIPIDREWKIDKLSITP